MSLDYPTSVPEYNKLRFLTSGSIDLGEKNLCALVMPQEFARYFWGAVSLLSDVNMWEKYGNLSPEEMVDIANNEVECMEFCTAVYECIKTTPEIWDEIVDIVLTSDEFNDKLREIIERILTNQEGTQSGMPEFDDLDYVWGGLLNALPEFQSAVVDVVAVANLAGDASTMILNIPGVNFLAANSFQVVEAMFDVTVTIIEAYLTNTDTEEIFLCGIFDSICSRGVPYLLKPEDIVAGWEAIDSFEGVPIVSISTLVKLLFSNDKFNQLFILGGDEPDNDWQGLCSCSPVWEAVVDLKTENILSINTVFGQWTSGVGYEAVPHIVTGFNRKIIEASISTDPFTIRELEFTVTEVPVSPNNAASQVRYGVSSPSRINTQFDVLNATNRSLTVEISPQLEDNTFLSVQRLPAQPSNAGASSVVTQMRVVGVGDVPSQLVPYIV